MKTNVIIIYAILYPVSAFLLIYYGNLGIFFGVFAFAAANNMERKLP